MEFGILKSLMSVIQTLTHHATLFVRSERKSFVQQIWEELHTESPAHILHDITVFDIDTARALTSWANAPYAHKKIALLSFHTITIPAQNALLKILEEPKANIQFILVTTNREALIPTLYSRLQHLESAEELSISTIANIFLSTPSRERMKLPEIVALLSATDEEDRKNREGVRSFILDIVPILKKHPKYSSLTLLTIEMASYAGDPSASGKAIVEYLSLLLPELKV